MLLWSIKILYLAVNINNNFKSITQLYNYVIVHVGARLPGVVLVRMPSGGDAPATSRRRSRRARTTRCPRLSPRRASGARPGPPPTTVRHAVTTTTLVFTNSAYNVLETTPRLNNVTLNQFNLKKCVYVCVLRYSINDSKIRGKKNNWIFHV